MSSFFIFPSLRTCSYSLSLGNLVQSSFFILVFSTFWTPQYAPLLHTHFLYVSLNLFSQPSAPCLFVFFRAFHCLHLISLCLFLLLLFFICLDTCQTKSPNSSKDLSQPPATQRGRSPRNRASPGPPRHSRVYRNSVTCGSLNDHRMCSIFISVTGSAPPAGEMAATALGLQT